MTRYWALLLLLILSCGPGSTSKVYEDLSRQDQARFDKYILLGKDVYEQNCLSCHQADGNGLRGIIPPLVNSDYLEQNQEYLPCLLRHGTKDTIIVNGKTYPPQMPAHTISNIELAEVITFINNSWGNEIKFVPVKEIDRLLQNCH